MEKRVWRYRTIVTTDHEKLDDLVNETIKDNWQPFGGAYVCDGIPENILFYQPMVPLKQD
jgi:hypothetical protein